MEGNWKGRKGGEEGGDERRSKGEGEVYMYTQLYIPQAEQHEPEGQMLFCLGNVTYLLHVTPSNPLPHPFHFVLFQFKDLVAKQLQKCIYIHVHVYMSVYTYCIVPGKCPSSHKGPPPNFDSSVVCEVLR